MVSRRIEAAPLRDALQRDDRQMLATALMTDLELDPTPGRPRRERAVLHMGIGAANSALGSEARLTPSEETSSEFWRRAPCGQSALCHLRGKRHFLFELVAERDDRESSSHPVLVRMSRSALQRAPYLPTAQSLPDIRRRHHRLNVSAMNCIWSSRSRARLGS
jgi:hypothetical protein